MSKLWLTADWHLGENRFDVMMRPFKSQEEMLEEFIARHNALVKPDDRVVVVGDVVYRDTPEFLKHVSRFNGTKTLIRGNHDRVFSDAELMPYFEKIVADGDGIELDIDGIPCYVVHYPTCARADRFNLVGHVHGAWKFQLNALNVGVDTNFFAPYSEDDVPKIKEAINKFYDEDVWAAYHETNMMYKGLRGKKGRYFKP